MGKTEILTYNLKTKNYWFKLGDVYVSRSKYATFALEEKEKIPVLVVYSPSGKVIEQFQGKEINNLSNYLKNKLTSTPAEIEKAKQAVENQSVSPRSLEEFLI